LLRADDRAKDNIETRSSEETVYDLGPGVTPPRLLHQVRPERGDAPGFRLKGKVVITLVVTSAGQPSRLKVIESIDNDVDQSALRAVEQWRFAPARKDGKAVAVRVTVEISFNDI
jgi:TonB family protein